MINNNNILSIVQFPGFATLMVFASSVLSVEVFLSHQYGGGIHPDTQVCMAPILHQNAGVCYKEMILNCVIYH